MVKVQENDWLLYKDLNKSNKVACLTNKNDTNTNVFVFQIFTWNIWHVNTINSACLIKWASPDCRFFFLLIWPVAVKLETGNKPAFETDSHQGQSVKPLLDFQVSLTENTRGWVKPGKRKGRAGVWGGEFKIVWRMWLDYWLTILLVHHSGLGEKPAGSWIINLEKARLLECCFTSGRLTIMGPLPFSPLEVVFPVVICLSVLQPN